MSNLKPNLIIYFFTLLMLLSIVACEQSTKKQKALQTIEDNITLKKKNLIKEFYLKQFWKKIDTLDLDTVTVFGNSQMYYHQLPSAFFRMTRLKFVHLDTETNLDTLTDEIDQLIELEILEITKSNLKYLPKNIGKLTNLKKLTIAWGGGLTEIPPEIGNLSKLEELDLFRNKLTTLPDEISKLKNLKKLILGDNNFSEFERSRISRLLPKCEIQFEINTVYRK